MIPRKAVPSYEIAAGIHAYPGGFAFIEPTRTLVCADAHFAYEDVIEAALPMWSTHEGIASLAAITRTTGAREIVILGDIVHGAHMTQTAAAAVQRGLDELRSMAAVALVVGNHEGRSRAKNVLGETHDAIERAGWTLLHGDRPQFAGARTMIGHLHPSLRLGGGASAPVFLCAPTLIVVPALTPYSPGLSVTSASAAAALRRYGVRAEGTEVVAVGDACVYPFGNLAALGAALAAPGVPARNPFRRPRLRHDPR